MREKFFLPLGTLMLVVIILTTTVWAESELINHRVEMNDNAGGMRAYTPNPLIKVDNNGTGQAINAESDGVIAVRGESKASGGAGVAGYGFASGGVGVFGQGADMGIYGYSTYGWGGYFYGNLYTSGRVGIGTTNPLQKLHVNGVSRFDVGGGSISVSTPGGWPGIIAFSKNGHRRDIQYYDNKMTITVSGSSSAPSSTNGLQIFETGKVAVKVLQILGGSDLSEQFDIRGKKENLSPSPGMVVSIDSTNPGDLVVSTKAYDRKVAGIISGAGGVNPGMLMGQKGSKADGANPVALTGRVYALADASYGAIEPGDLLTTSDTIGHAKKISDYARAHGATLGKAMSSLREGKGLVLVLVALQ